MLLLQCSRLQQILWIICLFPLSKQQFSATHGFSRLHYQVSPKSWNMLGTSYSCYSVYWSLLKESFDFDAFSFSTQGKLSSWRKTANGRSEVGEMSVYLLVGCLLFYFIYFFVLAVYCQKTLWPIYHLFRLMKRGALLHTACNHHMWLIGCCDHELELALDDDIPEELWMKQGSLSHKWNVSGLIDCPSTHNIVWVQGQQLTRQKNILLEKSWFKDVITLLFTTTHSMHFLFFQDSL